MGGHSNKCTKDSLSAYMEAITQIEANMLCCLKMRPTNVTKDAGKRDPHQHCPYILPFFLNFLNGSFIQVFF